MPKTVITPPGTVTPIAPFSPGTMADGVVYVSGTLAFDKDNNVACVGEKGAIGVTVPGGVMTVFGIQASCSVVGAIWPTTPLKSATLETQPKNFSML